MVERGLRAKEEALEEKAEAVSEVRADTGLGKAAQEKAGAKGRSDIRGTASNVAKRATRRPNVDPLLNPRTS